MSDDSIFTVCNHHGVGSGVPPKLEDSASGDDIYRSYFENEHGEQWILLHNSTTDRVAVYAGDCGWEKHLTVRTIEESLSDAPGEFAEYLRNGTKFQAVAKRYVVCEDGGRTVVISQAESRWIAACMRAVDARRKK